MRGITISERSGPPHLPHRPRGVPELVEALDACREGRGHGSERGDQELPGDLGGVDVPRTLDVVDAVLDLLSVPRQVGARRGDSHHQLRHGEHRSRTGARRATDRPAGLRPAGLARCGVDPPSSRGHAALQPMGSLRRRRTRGLGPRRRTDRSTRGRSTSPPASRNWQAMGVDGIITNVPRSARQALSG